MRGPGAWCIQALHIFAPCFLFLLNIAGRAEFFSGVFYISEVLYAKNEGNRGVATRGASLLAQRLDI